MVGVQNSAPVFVSLQTLGCTVGCTKQLMPRFRCVVYGVALRNKCADYVFAFSFCRWIAVTVVCKLLFRMGRRRLFTRLRNGCMIPSNYRLDEAN